MDNEESAISKKERNNPSIKSHQLPHGECPQKALKVQVCL